MRRVVFWQDSNGCIFVLNHLGSEGSNAHPLVIEDITVVYARSGIYPGFALIGRAPTSLRSL